MAMRKVSKKSAKTIKKKKASRKAATTKTLGKAKATVKKARKR